MLPETNRRVPAHTASEINREILAGTLESVRWHESHPDRIGARLRELDREWDVERALEANAATLAFAGAALAMSHDRRWAALPLVVGGFLLQHALQGWCPPLPVLRRMGFRTSREIETERIALKALRGDFGRFEAPAHEKAPHAVQAARM